MNADHTQAGPDKTVLITGAARRIGAALARDLHANGMKVIIHYNRSTGPANDLAASLNEKRPDSAFLVQADLVNGESYDDMASQAAGCTGRIDVLINNASVFYPTRIGNTSLHEWDEVIGTNMKAPYFLAQACLGILQESRGCIINITDIHGTRPLKDHPVYSTAKAGLIMLTKAMAKELGPEIRVNAISPGAILWPEKLKEEKKREILSRTILKRAGTPQDICNAARFLIRDADYMTGQILNIDGGRTLFY